MAEQKYRLGVYVEKATYEKIIAMQVEERAKQGRKVSQGEILDKLVQEYESMKEGK